MIILDEFLGLSVAAKKCCRHRQPGRLSPPPAAFQVNSVVTSIIRSTEYGQHVVFFREKSCRQSKCSLDICGRARIVDVNLILVNFGTQLQSVKVHQKVRKLATK